MKKYTVTQRFPNFFSGFTPEVADFDTLEELYNVLFVKRRMSQPDFVRLAISRISSTQQILMLELADESYWAIGWLNRAQDCGLPLWIAPVRK